MHCFLQIYTSVHIRTHKKGRETLKTKNKHKAENQRIEYSSISGRVNWIKIIPQQRSQWNGLPQPELWVEKKSSLLRIQNPDRSLGFKFALPTWNAKLQREKLTKINSGLIMTYDAWKKQIFAFSEGMHSEPEPSKIST